MSAADAYSDYGAVLTADFRAGSLISSHISPNLFVIMNSLPQFLFISVLV